MSSFNVVIIGRTNVGKSTLFNRIIGEKIAIVDNQSGVTRDRLFGESEWNGKKFNILDTGGFNPRTEEDFEKRIKSQVQIALNEGGLILFVCDVTTGITDLDLEITNILRKSVKDTILVINKVDNHERFLESSEFYSLGFEKQFPVSSINGMGTGELLDEISSVIPYESDKINEKPKALPVFSIIGQPNVGKSSLFNSLIGQTRIIVSEVPGTTRDSIYVHYRLFQKEFTLIDTAGIRRIDKVTENLEYYSVIRAIKALEDSDVCFLLIDATKGISGQDLNLFSLAVKKGKGIVILINKWDLIPKEPNSIKVYEQKIRDRLSPFVDIPILFISALNRTRIYKAVETGLEVFENKRRKIPTSKLNDVMLRCIALVNPPVVRGKPIKIKYVTQIQRSTPSFAFFCNFPDSIKLPYRNFLENQLRDKFNFKGVPIRIYFRKK